ncbi:hypothetical protein [Bacillus tropicus]|uniref:hypothetical protein n=1 Tax=Bacillus tropicus TaxID=2026188 RepID=UPI001CFD0303|nr:hypothetical protein [Bacillus tropicus]USK97368.1 hypothetical protein LIS81_01850 [Bacillus tropicus]
MAISNIYIKRKTTTKLSDIEFLLNNDLLNAVEELKFKEKELSTLKESILPLLEQEIYSNEIHRIELIKIKRKIFNDKHIKESEEELLRSINTLKMVGSSYLEKMKEIEEGNKLLVAKFEEHKEIEFLELQRMFSKKGKLYNTLLMTNPNIQGNLDKFLGKSYIEQTKNDRKLQSTLINFLIRSSLKCSPLADLTSTAVLGLKYQNKKGKKIYTRLNSSLLLKWYSEIEKMDYFIFKDEYELSQMLRINEGIMSNTVLSNSASSDLVNTKVLIKRYKENTMFKKALSFIENRRLTFDEFKMEMLHLLGDRGAEELKQLWRYFISEKIILPVKEIRGNDDGLLDTIISNMEEHQCDSHLLMKFRRIRMLIQDIENRLGKDILIEIKQVADEICDELMVEKYALNNLLYYDYVDFSDEKTEDFDEYENLINTYQLILSSFDPEIKRSLLIADVFRRKYGREAKVSGTFDILDALREFGENPEVNSDEILGMYFGNYDFNKPLNSIKRVSELHQISSEFIAMLLERISISRGDTVFVQLDELLDLAKRIKEAFPGYKTYSQNVFLQRSMNTLVLNHVYPGQGMFFLRFLKYYDANLAEYRRELSRITEIKNVIDINGTFGFNANIRSLVSKKTLTMPYTIKRDNELSLADLSLSYDRNKEQLIFKSKETHEQLNPLFLGSLIITATPPPVGIINTLGNNSAAMINLGEILLNEININNNGNEIVYLPRIEIGQDNKKIVLSRKKWKLKTSIIRELSHVNDIVSWENILTWFCENDLPTRFYVKNGEQRSLESMQKKGNEKPQFINLNSPGLCKNLFKIMNLYSEIIIEEELPIGKEENPCEYILESSMLNRKEQMECIN